MAGFIAPTERSRLMPMICNPLLENASLTDTMCGTCCMHGPHHVAQKSSSTILPLRFCELYDLPSMVVMFRSTLSPTLTCADAGAQTSAQTTSENATTRTNG